MQFRDKEERDRYIAKEIQARRDAAALLPIIRQVARSFDGKVYNIRFQKALQAAAPEGSPRIYTDTGFLKQLVIYIYHNSSQYTLAELFPEDMPDGKRINADKIIESARNHREKLLQEAHEIEQAAAQAEQMKAMIGGLIKQMKTLVDKIPYTVRDAYGIKSTIYF